jgi:hypothetical protein
MDKEIVRLPLPQWEELATQSSLKALVEQNNKGVITVKPLKLQGRPALVSGIMYGGLEGAAVYAWRLVPECDYTAPLPITHVYHDEDEILSGRRDRGDLRGLKVRWSGHSLIVQSKLEVHPTLPKATLTLAEAQAEDMKLRRHGGWRVLMTRKSEPVAWWLLRGHPVSEYESKFSDRILTVYYGLSPGIGSINLSPNGELVKELVEAEPTPQQALVMPSKAVQRPAIEAQLGFLF